MQSVLVDYVCFREQYWIEYHCSMDLLQRHLMPQGLGTGAFIPIILTVLLTYLKDNFGIKKAMNGNLILIISVL
jgi:hypothetical protein